MTAPVELRASRARTLGPFLLMAVLSAGFAGATVMTWQRWWLAGILLFLALACASGAGILGWRILARPVMVRIGPEGIFLKRLAVTIPWAALARIERREIAGETVFALIEAPEGHPVFDERGLLLGAALNEKAGLPPLAISMAHHDATPDAFADAVARFAPACAPDWVPD